MLRLGLDRHFAHYCRTGDPRSLARVFDGAATELYRLGYHLLGDRHAAEDLVQQTFVVAIESRASFEPGRAVLPWLCGVLTNRALQQRRQQRQRHDKLQHGSDTIADPVAQAAQEEVQATVHAAILALPDHYRQPLLLHLVHELEPKEIAEVLQRPGATVRTQLARGLEQLRARLPKGIGARAFAFVPAPLALGSIRAAVLQLAGANTAATVAAAMSMALTGTLLMKKALLTCIGLLIAVVLWTWWPDAAPPLMQQQVDATTAAPVAASMPVAAAHGETERPVRLAVESDIENAPAALEVAVTWSDGSLAADVTLRLRPMPLLVEAWLQVARTDPYGVARFAGLHERSVQVVADRGASLQIDLLPGAIQRATLQLHTGIDIRGRVVDPERRPLAGATVWMSVHPGSDDSEPATITAADGTFSIRSVPPTHVLAATAPGHATASVVFVDAADEGREVVLIARHAPATLVGTVLAPDGRPVVGARVLVGVTSTSFDKPYHQRMFYKVAGCDLWPSRFLRTDAWGRFRAEGLPAVPWPIWVGTPDFAPARVIAQLRDRGETAITMQLTDGAVVQGTARDDTGAPVAGALIYLFREYPSVHPAFDLGRRLHGTPLFARARATTDAEGRFLLRRVMPGTVTLNASDQRGDARQPRTIVTGEVVQWDPVLVANDLPMFEGTVVDEQGEPLPGWTIECAIGDDPDANNAVANNDHGKFRLSARGEGPHRLTASPSHPRIGSSIEVGTYAPSDSPLRLVVPRHAIPTASLRGAISAPDGGPCASCRIHLGHRGIADSTSIVADEHAAFCFEALPAGECELTVETSDFGSVSIGTFSLRDREVTDIGHFRIPLPGHLEVEVVDVAGRPAPAAWLRARPLGPQQTRAVGGLEHAEGISRGALQPGRWELWTLEPTTLATMPCEVVAGQTTKVRFVIPEGVRFLLRSPPANGKARRLRVRWHDTNGALLRDEPLTLTKSTVESELSAPPGRYTIEVIDENGRTARRDVEFAIGQLPQTIDLPVPDRQ